MAELSPLLVNQTRWSDLLKQLAVLKGLDHVELGAVLTAALVIENDRPEHKYLAGEHLAWGQYLQAAIAAIVGYVGLRNPAGSGKILIVEDWWSSTPGSKYYLGLARTPTVTQQSTEQPRDTRIQKTGAFGTFAPNIVGQIVSARSDTIAVTPFVVQEMVNNTTLLSTPNDFKREPFVLAPDDVAFIFRSDGAGGTVANAAIQAQFVWRERTLEPTET